MGRVETVIMEWIIDFTEKKGLKPFTKEDLFLHIYFSRRRDLPKYSFETVSRQLRILAAKGYIYTIERTKKNGNLRHVRTLYLPKIKLMKAQLNRLNTSRKLGR